MPKCNEATGDFSASILIAMYLQNASLHGELALVVTRPLRSSPSSMVQRSTEMRRTIRDRIAQRGAVPSQHQARRFGDLLVGAGVGRGHADLNIGNDPLTLLRRRAARPTASFLL